MAGPDLCQAVNSFDFAADRQLDAVRHLPTSKRQIVACCHVVSRAPLPRIVAVVEFANRIGADPPS